MEVRGTTYNKLKLTIFLSASTYGIANTINVIYDLDCRGPWMEAFCLLYKICFENQCDWNGELYLSCHQPNDRWSTICGSRIIYGVRPKWRYLPTFFWIKRHLVCTFLMPLIWFVYLWSKAIKNYLSLQRRSSGPIMYLPTYISRYVHRNKQLLFVYKYIYIYARSPFSTLDWVFWIAFPLTLYLEV